MTCFKLRRQEKWGWDIRKESNVPAKSCSGRLRPLTGGRDVLVLNLPTGHTERISTHFYKHTKHHWYTCRPQDEFVFTCVDMSARLLCLHVPCEILSFLCVCRTPPPSRVPFLQPCKASKAKQRHHCVGASLSKMRQEWPRRCLLVIFSSFF